MSEKKSNSRTRNYATVVYPESAPEMWQTILAEFKIPAFISPLHDSDKNANGEDKKPHYHVMLMYDSVKTEDQAREVFDKIGGVGCERVNSIRSYARYLCHLDNPDKHQYNTEDVKQFCGTEFTHLTNCIIFICYRTNNGIIICTTELFNIFGVILVFIGVV